MGPGGLTELPSGHKLDACSGEDLWQGEVIVPESTHGIPRWDVVPPLCLWAPVLSSICHSNDWESKQDSSATQEALSLVEADHIWIMWYHAVPAVLVLNTNGQGRKRKVEEEPWYWKINRNFPGRTFQTKGTTFVEAKETPRSYLVILGYMLWETVVGSWYDMSEKIDLIPAN